MNAVDKARNLMAYELSLFANTIEERWRDNFFHPMNQDEWVRRFTEWLAAKQEKLAEVRASND